MNEPRESKEEAVYWAPDKPQLLWVLGWTCICLAIGRAVENPFFTVILAVPLGAVGLGLLISGIWTGWEMRRQVIAALVTAALTPCAAIAPCLG